MLSKLQGTKLPPVVSLHCHLLYLHNSLVQIVNIREMQNKTAILHEIFLWLDMVELIQGTVKTGNEAVAYRISLPRPNCKVLHWSPMIQDFCVCCYRA